VPRHGCGGPASSAASRLILDHLRARRRRRHLFPFPPIIYKQHHRHFALASVLPTMRQMHMCVKHAGGPALLEEDDTVSLAAVLLPGSGDTAPFSLNCPGDGCVPRSHKAVVRPPLLGSNREVQRPGTGVSPTKIWSRPGGSSSIAMAFYPPDNTDDTAMVLMALARDRTRRQPRRSIPRLNAACAGFSAGRTMRLLAAFETRDINHDS